jgi:hypothetical protein
MFKTTSKNVPDLLEGRVLGRVLSREEIARVSGGADAGPPTDSWVDKGVCTPKSDPGYVSEPSA